MKFLFLADTQISYRSQSYMEQLDKTWDFLLETVLNEKPDIVVHLGDVFDGMSTLDVREMLWAYRRFSELCDAIGSYSSEAAGLAYRLWVLKGNHDLADSVGRDSSIEILGCNGRAWTVTEPAIWRYGEKDVLVLPYTREPQEFLDGLSLERPLRAVFSHVDWLGLRMTPYRVSMAGADPTKFQEKFPGVPVFNGHYHTPVQEGPITVVGSPLFRDFRDLPATSPRGFYLWDTATKDFGRRVDNPNTFLLADEEVTTVQDVEGLVDRLKDDLGRTRIKIRAHTREAAEAARDLFRGALWLAVHEDAIPSVGMDHEVQVDLSTSPAEIVKKAVEVAPESLSKEALMKCGLEIFG